MYKASKFNFWAPVDDNRYLLFNGVSGAMYELDAQERELALEWFDSVGEVLGPVGESSPCYSLVDGGFIIPEQLDEIELLLAENQSECIHHSVLDLVLVPTYNCNFRCVYCYVDFKAGNMSLDVEERILRYIERLLPQYAQINITWFGGEPLLCLDTVLRVSPKIKKIADQYKVRLFSFIASNGYLLHLETARKLVEEADIRFFHITIDGPRRHHDRLRVLSGGGPSYAIIMKNLLDILTHIPQAHITLRMNADEENIDSLHEVLDDIPHDFHQRIQINIFPILHGGEIPSVWLYKKINQVIRHALEDDYLYYDNHIPVGRKTFCSADKLGNFQVGFDGTLYKCSPATDKIEVEVGSLCSDGSFELNESCHAWHEAPALRDFCADCPYFCFCLGGCRLERLRGVNDKSCMNRYADIENLIVNRYLGIINDSFDAPL